MSVSQRDLPLIIVHKGKQPYLKKVIHLAESYGNRVILLGDESNKTFCHEWYNCNEYSSEKLAEFNSKYIHMSTLTEEFERFCFERHFYILDFVQKKDINAFVEMDSDVLLYRHFVQDDYMNCTWSGTWNGKGESVSPHFSFFTKKKLADFVDFCLELYEQPLLEKLEKRWIYFLDNKLAGGNCDMTALYFWMQMNQDGKNDFSDEHYINLGDGNEKEKDNKLKIVRPYFRRGIPYVGLEQIYLIHACGWTKVFIAPLSKKRNIYLAYWSVIFKARILTKLHLIKCKLLR